MTDLELETIELARAWVDAMEIMLKAREAAVEAGFRRDEAVKAEKKIATELIIMAGDSGVTAIQIGERVIVIDVNRETIENRPLFFVPGTLPGDAVS